MEGDLSGRARDADSRMLAAARLSRWQARALGELVAKIGYKYAGVVKARLMQTAYKSFPANSVATDPTTGKTYSSQYDIFTVGASYLDISA